MKHFCFIYVLYIILKPFFPLSESIENFKLLYFEDFFLMFSRPCRSQCQMTICNLTRLGELRSVFWFVSVASSRMKAVSLTPGRDVPNKNFVQPITL